ncbi:MAG: Fe-S cluster domain-containing protein [Proteobacteria bacterium]|nr:Fe-S cluster domain-containing protein [Pseudomonadota bacterium]
MDTELIQIALTGLALLGSIGIFFGIGLAIAAHKFAVERNPKVEEVMEVLPQAQCGGCGYAGCEGYARAVVEDPNVPPNLCFPGKAAVGEKVAKITQKEMAKVENSVARVRCDRQDGHVSHKHVYIGFDSCVAANIAYGGPSKCQYACIGMGDCARACPFKAIEMHDGMPFILADNCVGCGKCAKTCPKQVIEVMPADAKVYVPCSSKGFGKEVKDVCEVGCIGCKMCVKACPAGAVSIADNKVQIDTHKCLEYEGDCGQACVAKCPRKIFRPVPPKGSYDIFAELKRKAAEEKAKDEKEAKPKAEPKPKPEKAEVAKAEVKPEAKSEKADTAKPEKAEVAKAEVTPEKAEAKVVRIDDKVEAKEAEAKSEDKATA